MFLHSSCESEETRLTFIGRLFFSLLSLPLSRLLWTYIVVLKSPSVIQRPHTAAALHERKKRAFPLCLPSGRAGRHWRREKKKKCNTRDNDDSRRRGPSEWISKQQKYYLWTISYMLVRYFFMYCRNHFGAVPHARREHTHLLPCFYYYHY